MPPSPKPSTTAAAASSSVAPPSFYINRMLMRHIVTQRALSRSRRSRPHHRRLESMLRRRRACRNGGDAPRRRLDLCPALPGTYDAPFRGYHATPHVASRDAICINAKTAISANGSSLILHCLFGWSRGRLTMNTPRHSPDTASRWRANLGRGIYLGIDSTASH